MPFTIFTDTSAAPFDAWEWTGDRLRLMLSIPLLTNTGCLPNASHQCCDGGGAISLDLGLEISELLGERKDGLDAVLVKALSANHEGADASRSCP